MNKKILIGVLMVAIFLMMSFNTVTGMSQTNESINNFISTPSVNANSISYYNTNENNLKNVTNPKFNVYEIDNYSILSCNNLLKININNRSYGIKWSINMVVGNTDVQLHFHEYNVFYRNNSIILSEFNQYATVYNILSVNNNTINSNIVIKSNIEGIYNIEFVEGNSIKNYRTIDLSNHYNSSSINGVQTSWHKEMDIFHNGIIRINNNSYQLILNFNNIKLNKNQIYKIDPVIKPMRLPLSPCATTLAFKLYDNSAFNIPIYNIENEIIVDGTSTDYNAYYCLDDNANWHEVSCVASHGNDYSKINACFQGYFGTSWRSSVCTKITLSSGTYTGYIHNEIWSYAPDINQWTVYKNTVVVNSQISADSNNCYREYIVST